MNILHLLSWFPTPDDPTLGNFCIRMIDALPEDCHSIILSVCDGKDMTKSFEVKEIPGAHHTLHQKTLFQSRFDPPACHLPSWASSLALEETLWLQICPHRALDHLPASEQGRFGREIEEKDRKNCQQRRTHHARQP